MKLGRCAILLLLPLSLFAAGGCGKEAGKVTGKVTMDDKPLEKGSIMFIPADGKGQPATGEIKNGQYSVEGVSPGSNSVKITSSKVIGQEKVYKDEENSPKRDITEQVVAEEFNEKSKLTADIKAGNQELPPFAVKEKESSKAKEKEENKPEKKEP